MISPPYVDFSDADKFLNLATTRRALGVGDREWEGCNYDVHADMSGDWLRDFVGLLPEMLEDGVRIMIYAGENDLICNWLGNYRSESLSYFILCPDLNLINCCP